MSPVDSPRNRGSVVVAGFGDGLGFALASKAVSKGYSVACIARNRSSLEGGCRSLRDLHPSASVYPYAADLTVQDEVIRVVEQIRAQHPLLHALINNAGKWVPTGPTSKLARETIDDSLAANFYSAFHITQELLRNVRINSIVGIGATASLGGWDDVAAFCLGKGAMRTYLQALARELSPQGIHVSHVVIDGLIDHARTRALNLDTPSHHFMDPSSIATSVLQITEQHRSAWTFELDLRPFNESW